MQLDQNTERCQNKYALINMRRLQAEMSQVVQGAFQTLLDTGFIELGPPGDENEFFVMKLKDVHSARGLLGYVASAALVDPEYAMEVRELITRAGENSKFCKHPD